jgi:threonine/homoserine/homoserine lactone efflux protein
MVNCTGSVLVNDGSLQAMTTAQIIAVWTFALIGSFTPGPNNTIAMVTGVHHGLRAALPHVFGVPSGFATLLLAGLAGMAALITASTTAMLAIKIAGIAYLLWLAWGLFGSSALAEARVVKPFTFLQSAAFQYANPKAWMLAVAITSSYANAGTFNERAAHMVIAFFTAAVASLLLWAWMGEALSHWLKQGKRLVWFNRTMALSLAATAMWMGFGT